MNFLRPTFLALAVGLLAALTPARAASYYVSDPNGDLSVGSLGGALYEVGVTGSTTTNTITFGSFYYEPISLVQSYPVVTEANGYSLTIEPFSNPTTNTLTISGGTFTALTLQGNGAFTLQNLNITGSGTGINIGSAGGDDISQRFGFESEQCQRLK